MIPLTLIALALVALLAYREHLHVLERRELYTRIQTPSLAPLLAPTPEEPEDDTVGYREEDEVNMLVHGEPE